jgi:diguanylate cyclase (GGDEF)-like protein
MSAFDWAMVGGMTVGAIAVCARLVDAKRRVTFEMLLAMSYLGLAFMVLAQWLTGGTDSPLRELYLLNLLGTVCVHPPRRSGTFMLLSAGAIAAPLAYEGWTRAGAVDVVARGSLWFSLAFTGMLLMSYVRRQRVTLREQEQAAQELARVDALTGLPNRRALDEAVRVEVARVERSGRPSALLLVDVDRFKAINDRLGHVVGDDCLRQVARALTAELRGSDRCFRWGGDEFVLVLADADADTAQVARERVVAAVAGTCQVGDEPLSVSIGIAELGDARGLEALMVDADAQLFREKRAKATAL